MIHFVDTQNRGFNSLIKEKKKMAKTRVHALISGRVQGVFFRANILEKARKLGVFGWIRNLPDGRVEAVFEGEDKKVQEILAWSREGPPSARVEKVELEKEECREEFDDFKIKF